MRIVQLFIFMWIDIIDISLIIYSSKLIRLFRIYAMRRISRFGLIFRF
jgi:hypothetical protein